MGPFRQRPQFVADAHVFPVSRDSTAHLLISIKREERFQLLVGIVSLGLCLLGLVFRPALARLVAIGAETPAIGLGHQIAMLVEKIDVVDLLDRPSRKPRLVFDEIFEIGPSS